MVVRTKEEAKLEFARRLNAAISARHPKAPQARGRAKWLKTTWNNHGGRNSGAKISYESLRKWLVGLDIPIAANRMILSDVLGFSIEDLLDKELRSEIGDAEDATLAAIIDGYNNADAAGKALIAQVAQTAKQANEKSAPTKQRAGKKQ